MTNPFLIILLIAVPLIVRVKGILPPQDLLWRFPDYPIEADLFTYWKGRVLMVLAFLALVWPRRHSLPPRITGLTIFFLLTLLISTLWSGFPYLAMYGAPNYNEGALCWLAYVTILLVAVELPQATFIRIMRWSVYTMSVMCILQLCVANPFMLPGLHQLMSPETITTVRTSQIYGTLGNPNHLGLYCAMMLPFFVAMFEKRNVVAILLVCTMLLSSGSRLGFLAATIGCVSITWSGRERLPFVAGLFVIIGNILAFVWNPFRHNIDFGRLYIWKVSIAATWSKILIGEGPSTLLNYLPQGEPGIYVNAIIDRPHNIYLQLWHAVGLVGLLALLAVIVLSFRRARTEYRAAIVGFLAAAFFTDSFVGVTPLFFALLGNCWRSDDD